MPNGILLAQDHFTGVSKMIACLSLQRISSALRKRVGESGIMFGAGKTRELLTDERAAMEAYKREFIEFMVQSDVLKFGDFTLKSGRKSPFFMNAGAYVTGEQLHRLGLYYAQAINDNFGLDFDVVFGPAYKGIPLAVVTAMALQALAKYRDRQDVEDAVQRGIAALSALQEPNGAYLSWDEENSESVSQVIVALTELGVSLDDERFVKNGQTLPQVLERFACEDGSYRHTLNGGGDEMATEQALYALAAIHRAETGETTLYDMTDVMQ